MGPGEDVGNESIRQLRQGSEQAARFLAKLLKELTRDTFKMTKRLDDRIYDEMESFSRRIDESINPERTSARCLQEQARLTKNQLVIMRENGGLDDRQFNDLYEKINKLSVYPGDKERTMSSLMTMDLIEEKAAQFNEKFKTTNNINIYKSFYDKANDTCRIGIIGHNDPALMRQIRESRSFENRFLDNDKKNRFRRQKTNMLTKQITRGAKIITAPKRKLTDVLERER